MAAVGVAVPLAAVLVITGAVVVVLVEAPQRELLVVSWRVLLVDRGTWLPVALVAAALTYALRPVPPGALARWLRRRDLPAEVAAEAAAELRRTRVLRTVPAALGACIGLGAGTAYNLALDVLGQGAAATVALGEVAADTAPLRWLLAGYFLGALGAEATRRRPAPAPGSARLLPRRPMSYLTRVARLLPSATASVVLVAVAAWIVASPEQVAGPEPDLRDAVVVFLVLAVAVPAAQRWIVARPQRQPDAARRALDDTFRSSAVHALVGASVAAGLAVLADVLGGLWNVWVEADVSGIWMLALAPVGLVLVAATYAVWLAYGTGHPGRRPDTEMRQP
ncbi:MAG: hypothetical protein ACLFRD_10705 [Nitriliruptoraceae bacterium]